MKYNDKQTRLIVAKHSENQQSDDFSFGKSERAIRRQTKRSVDKFTKSVYKYIEKDWWDSVDYRIKEKLYHEWGFYSTHINKSASFGKWINEVRETIKPNVGVYRQKVLKNLLGK